MRPNTEKDLKRILLNYNQGKFDRIKTAYLLIKLRDFNNSNDVFWDIGSFIAHDNREFGLSYEHAKSFIDKLLPLMNKPSGSVPGGLNNFLHGELLVTQEEMYQHTLERLSVFSIEADFNKHKDKFMTSVLENITGSQLKVKSYHTKQVLGFEISEIVPDAEGRKTIYVKVSAQHNLNEYREQMAKGEGPQVHMNTSASIGYPLMQSIPDGVEHDLGSYIWV